MNDKKTQNTEPRSLWSHRMLTQQIATRILTAMELQNVTLFELADKLRWAPAKVLRWIDGSMAESNLDVAEDGTLRELVDIGLALGQRWEWKIGKKA
jgi:hypothetical protein